MACFVVRRMTPDGPGAFLTNRTGGWTWDEAGASWRGFVEDAAALMMSRATTAAGCDLRAAVYERLDGEYRLVVTYHQLRRWLRRQVPTALVRCLGCGVEMNSGEMFCPNCRAAATG